MRCIGRLHYYSCAAVLVFAAGLALARPALAESYSAAVLADNPVAYYRLNETSGTTAANLGSGVGIDGTYVNIPGATANNTSNYGVPGPRPATYFGFEADNNSVFFDPEDESDNTDTTFPRVEVSVPDDSATSPLAITGALTLEAWIMRSEDLVAPGSNEGLVTRYRQDQNGAARSYVMYFESTTDGSNGTPDGTPGLGLALSSTGSFQSANSYEFAASIPIGQWTHVATVFDPGVRVAAYVNGSLVAEVIDDDVVDTPDDFQILEDPLYAGEGDFWIGQQFNGNDAWSFEGNIDEVAVYAAALSDEQIASHYAAAVPEPASWLLTMLTGAVLLGWRRHIA